MESLEAIRIDFFDDCEEGLAALDEGLRAFTREGFDPARLAPAAAAVHAIKGGAGAFGLEPLVRFSQAFESLLERIRIGRLGWTPEIARTVFDAAQALADEVRHARTATPPSAPLAQAEAEPGDVHGLIARVHGYAAARGLG